MFQGIMIIVFFLIIAFLMIMRKIPTLVALPVIAVGICLISGVPFSGVDAAGQPIGFLQTVLEAGAVRMASAYAAVIFGAWLGQIMNKTGVTETMIKKSAELGGDRPLVVTLVLSAVVALLFTTLSGLGSVIMVGSIVLPILVSVGVPAISASCIFLMAFATGLCFNVSNWQTYISLLGIDLESIKHFESILIIVTAIVTVIFILVEFKKNGVKFAFSAPVNDTFNPSEPQIKGLRGTLAMISPLIPIILVAVLKIPIIPAFICGIIWIAVFTSRGFAKTMNLITKTCYDGITDSAPAIILMIGIGILFLAVTHPAVKAVLEPFMKAIVPKGGLPYILFFIILAPLSLYRGPLNMFGLGSGVAALISGLGIMPNLAVMGAFLSVERIQGCGDPTNTQNVWTANFAEVDVNAITKKIILYLWLIAAIGIICSNFLFFK
jgi:H+/gluconate symporter-like permease